MASARPDPVPWRVLLTKRPVWGIILGRFFGDPIWWLFLVWLPKYLFDTRGLNLKEIGLSAWFPFVAADVGCLLGGWTSSYLIKRGWSVDRARKLAIVVGTLLMPVGVAAAYVSTPLQALVCISVTLFGFQYWVGNVQTLPSDFYPVRAVGSIAGYAGTAAAFGAMIFMSSTGRLVDLFGYTPPLIIAAVLGPVATLSLFALIRKVPATPSEV